jgi:hypothetical protein
LNGIGQVACRIENKRKAVIAQNRYSFFSPGRVLIQACIPW